jgi:hypothetical protein
MSSAIDGIARFPVVGRGICDLESFETLVAAARLELADIEAQPYVRLFIAWGRK